jgi:hypothetical protein
MKGFGGGQKNEPAFSAAGGYDLDVHQRRSLTLTIFRAEA